MLTLNGQRGCAESRVDPPDVHTPVAATVGSAGMSGMAPDPYDDVDADSVEGELLALLAPRTGHFQLESGQHGDLWLDLDRLFGQPAHLRRFIAPLAERLAASYPAIDAICGPLIGGAFVAQMVAEALDVAFVYTERIVSAQGDSPDVVTYRLPHALQNGVKGQAIAIVDDAINAGSAIRGTFAALQNHGAIPVALGALLVVGGAGAEFAADRQIPIERLVHLPSGLWTPRDCPLCAAGRPFDDPAWPEPAGTLAE